VLSAPGVECLPHSCKLVSTQHTPHMLMFCSSPVADKPQQTRRPCSAAVQRCWNHAGMFPDSTLVYGPPQPSDCSKQSQMLALCWIGRVLHYRQRARNLQMCTAGRQGGSPALNPGQKHWSSSKLPHTWCSCRAAVCSKGAGRPAPVETPSALTLSQPYAHGPSRETSLTLQK
jgi:hypothetical protein